MKKLFTLLLFSSFFQLNLKSQIRTSLSPIISDVEVLNHLKTARINHEDSLFIKSATSSTVNSFQIGTTDNSHFPYPVIFIHGLVGSADTWFDFYDYALKQNWIYGGQLRFNLNADQNLSYSNIYSAPTDVIDFNSNIQPADFYLLNFNCSINGDSYGSSYNTETQSNQASIAKQGLAIRNAIGHVLNATGKNKVILFGHSMGGLAARQYIQNENFWQPDNHHHIAKLITSGTPHGGSNATGTFLLQSFLDVDERSDAVRDLRRSYFYSGEDGTYLYGGLENSQLMSDNLSGFYNYDVDCNGIEVNQIIGLNEKNIYTNLDYSCIIGDWLYDISLNDPGDGVVEVKDAQLKNFYNITSETFIQNSNHLPIPLSYTLHTALPEFNRLNFLGLDEPDYYNLAYEIEINKDYNGFVTEQASDAEFAIDYDDFIFSTSTSGLLSISLQNVNSSSFGVSILKKDNLEVIFNQIYNSTDFSTEEVSLPAGSFYLEFYSTASEESWKYPYGFRLNWANDIPVSAAESNNDLKVKITPNPFYSKFQLSVEGLQNINTNIFITNEFGEIVLSKKIKELQFDQEINMSHLQSGIYFLSIQNDKIFVTEKLIKI